MKKQPANDTTPAKPECKCISKDRKPINTAPMYHGANCPVFLKGRENGEY